MQNEKKYSIGLDLGTNSVGWAVVDEDYRVMKHKGRHMWGARLWEPAEPAQSTRMLRSSRRRMERRKERIRLLQELFGKDVLAVDDSFFIKLKESFLHNEKEDKVLGRLNIHNLFDGEYSDKNFYAEYPTIYHLRKKLVESQEKMDPRFIYLVMHHIIKYRGNFLYDGDISQFNGSLNSGIEAFFEKLCEGDLDERIPYADKINCITEILASRNIPKYISKKAIKSEQDIKKTKEESIKELFASDKAMQDFVSQFVRAVLGYEFVFQSILFEEVDEAKDKIKIKFSKGYEEKKDEYLNSAGENAEIILLLEAIYNNLLFHEIMCDESTVYAAMIKRFEKHKKDLKTLKMLLREDKKTYADMFRKENAINYGSYIKSTIVGKKSKKTNREDFYTAIKKALENVKDSKEKQAVLSEIDNDTFLPKINDVKNGAIPYQFHLEELKIILHNQGKYYPELEKNADKIISIMSFRRPYSIGVLLSDKTKSRFSWADKRIEERVYPWNFEQLVNVDALSGKFIERMTNNCQYFKDEKVLPLNSITYQRYIVLNELNKIKINDKPISLEMKKKVFDELFCCKKSVSVKDFAFFYNRNYGENIVSNDIQGLSEDEKFLGKMSTLIDFKRIFKEQFSIKNIDTYEKAVKIITLFEDKEIRKRQLKNECNFDNEQINSLSKLSYKKWGKYSYKLLNGIIGKNRKTILQEMYDGINKYGECLHINELLFGEEYGFKEQLPIEEEKINKFAYEKHISNLYCSPDVKRQVWQALNIVEEIEKIMGYAPSDIYLENTRNPEQKKKKESRVDALMKIYSSILEEKGEDYKKYFDNTAYEQLKNQKQNDEKLDNEKLFLYITQMGRCMYSGEKIEISKLNDCEIDHIIPRSYIKDDSFANKVLVN